MPGGKLKLVVSEDVRKLLESAADGFLSPLRATPGDPFPSPDYLLALRQGGLRDDLFRLAAQAGSKGWFDPPLCIFHELPKWLGEPETRALSDVERTALLGDVVRRVGNDVFGRSNRPEFFLDSLDNFFGELVAEGVTPREFETALAQIESRPDSFNTRKNAELARLFGEYVTTLSAAGVRDGRAGLATAAKMIVNDPDGFAERLGGRSEIRFVGLADLRGGWRNLLTALATSPVVEQVSIYTIREFTESDLDGLPPVEREHLAGETSVQGQLFREVVPNCGNAPRGFFSVIEGPNTERELGEVALYVRRLAVDGVPLHRIAVVARRGRPYVDLALRALKVVGVPATARQRIGFDEIPVVKAVLSLLAAAAEGWTRRGLVEISDTPYFVPLLDPTVLNFVGYRRSVRGLSAWIKATRNLQQEAESTPTSIDGEEQLNWKGPSAERIEQTLRGLEEFKTIVGDISRERTLAEWVEWIKTFLDDDPLEIQQHIYKAPDSNHEPIKRDIAGWRGLQTVLSDWDVAVDQWGDAVGTDPTNANGLSASAFLKRLREILSGQVGIWTRCQRGVQVMESLAAAYREFDHLFLVGMESGAFPLPAPRSPVLDDDDRESVSNAGIHLDTRRDWDVRERDLFRAIVSGAKHLTVSYPVLDAKGADTIRSSFVEALSNVADERTLEIDQFSVVTPGMPLFASEEMKGLVTHAASVERARLASLESPFAGTIEDDELRAWLAGAFDDNKLWSPSQIEAYAKCPWAYFSGRLLNVDKHDEPDEEMDASVRGILLHETLARFYETAARERGRPVFLRTPDLEWAQPLMDDALDAAFDAMERRAWTGHPILRQIKRDESKRLLRRYLAWEVDHHDKMDGKRGKAPKILRTGADAHELTFGESGDVILERKGVSFKFRGTIDRVDRGVDPRVENPERFVAAIDYKSSTGSVPGKGHGNAWNEGVVLQVPLYAYALTRILEDVKVSRVEYRVLSGTKPGAGPSGAYPHCLQLHCVDNKTHSIEEDPAAAEKMDHALERVVDHVLDLRSGKFPVSPAPTCGCPTYCHAYDICRVSSLKRPEQKR